jgi:hypothetical protein
MRHLFNRRIAISEALSEEYNWRVGAPSAGDSNLLLKIQRTGWSMPFFHDRGLYLKLSAIIKTTV